MPIRVIKNPKHVLFTSKNDPLGFVEQCDKITNFKKYGFTAPQLLGIDDLSNVAAAEIKKSFKLLALRFHPDKAPDRACAGSAFPILSDACVFLLHQKHALPEDNASNTVFDSTQNNAHATDVFGTFGAFFEDLFKNTDGFDPEQSKQLLELKRSFACANEASRVINLLKIELARIELNDFSHTLSTHALASKKIELLNQIEEISQRYIPTFLIMRKQNDVLN